jgi:hypothetical protein
MSGLITKTLEWCYLLPVDSFILCRSVSVFELCCLVLSMRILFLTRVMKLVLNLKNACGQMISLVSFCFLTRVMKLVLNLKNACGQMISLVSFCTWHIDPGICGLWSICQNWLSWAPVEPYCSVVAWETPVIHVWEMFGFYVSLIICFIIVCWLLLLSLVFLSSPSCYWMMCNIWHLSWIKGKGNKVVPVTGHGGP